MWDKFLQQNRKCVLTGIELKMPIKNQYKIYGTASLDRTDSKLGYTIDNTQWVLSEINLMKLDLQQYRFIDLCRKVSEYEGSVDRALS
jgi:hypothetical protein